MENVETDHFCSIICKWSVSSRRITGSHHQRNRIQLIPPRIWCFRHHFWKADIGWILFTPNTKSQNVSESHNQSKEWQVWDQGHPLWPYRHPAASLSLRFLICRMEIIIPHKAVRRANEIMDINALVSYMVLPEYWLLLFLSSQPTDRIVSPTLVSGYPSYWHTF